MAATCPIGFDVLRLRNAVEATYDRVGKNPETAFHFNMGADYAVNLLRYERSELNMLPKRATARFAGEERITECFDCFRDSRVEKNVSTTVGVHGANFFAQKGA